MKQRKAQSQRWVPANAMRLEAATQGKDFSEGAQSCDRIAAVTVERFEPPGFWT